MAAAVRSVAAQLQSMTRSADFTGIHLESIIELAGRGLCSQHGLDRLTSAKNTPIPGAGQHLAGWLMTPMRRFAFKTMAKKTPTGGPDVEALS